MSISELCDGGVNRGCWWVVQQISHMHGVWTYEALYNESAYNVKQNMSGPMCSRVESGSNRLVIATQCYNSSLIACKLKYNPAINK